MFDVFCQSCSRRRLVFAGQVRGIANDERGIHVVYECWCGAVGLWSTGRARTAHPSASAADEPLLAATA